MKTRIAQNVVRHYLESDLTHNREPCTCSTNFRSCPRAASDRLPLGRHMDIHATVGRARQLATLTICRFNIPSSRNQYLIKRRNPQAQYSTTPPSDRHSISQLVETDFVSRSQTHSALVTSPSPLPRSQIRLVEKLG